MPVSTELNELEANFNTMSEFAAEHLPLQILV